MILRETWCSNDKHRSGCSWEERPKRTAENKYIFMLMQIPNVIRPGFPKLDNLFGTLGSLSKASEKSPIDGISTIYFVSHSVAIHQVPPALVLR
jgi:hypothetical protein